MTKNAVATKNEAGLPANFGDDEIQGLEGLGYSEKSDDSLIPILSILQDNSGEVKKKHDKYMEGAEAGMLIIRALKMLINPESEEVYIQPAGFQRMWVRWEGEPGEGVVTGQYPFDDRPDEAELVKNSEGKDEWVMLDGSRLVDTRYHFGFLTVPGRVTDMPIVVPMGGTNHTVSRQWTTTMKEAKLPNGAKAPSWFRRYSLTTFFTQRGAQSWYKYEIGQWAWVQEKEQRDAGRSLFESLQKGEVSAATEADAPVDGTAAADDEAPI